MEEDSVAAANLHPNATIDLRRVTPLLIQLAAFLVLFKLLAIETSISFVPTRFFTLGLCCFAGFVIHYFVPFRWKKTTFIVISLIGAIFVLVPDEPTTGPDSFLWGYGEGIGSASKAIGVALVLGLAFYVCLRSRVRYWVRIAVIVAIAAVLAYGRNGNRWLPDNGLHWPLIGAIFMFRLIIYCYEVRSAAAPERLDDFLCYFFMLPNFYFLLFPVIDYTTFKRCYYAEDIHRTAQRGILWIARGTLHICLYRLTYHWLIIGPDEVSSFAGALRYIVPMFWLYLLVTGSFHIITGMLHLFGYKLPVTNRRYALACSFTDFWRRANIYWKDFMVKVFYYPAYFRLRRKNETLALVVGTIYVFVATTVLHGYQYFWLRNQFRISLVDIIFWIVMGTLVLLTVLWEARRSRRRTASPKSSRVLRILNTAGVYVVITLLWSMWYGNSLSDWVNVLTYWR